jgi:hypothetical protein
LNDFDLNEVCNSTLSNTVPLFAAVQSALACKGTTPDQVQGPATLRNLFFGVHDSQDEINSLSLIVHILTHLIPKLSSSSDFGFSPENRIAVETKSMLESSLRDTIELGLVRESAEQLQKSHLGLENSLSAAKKTMAEFEEKIVAYEEREAKSASIVPATAPAEDTSNQKLIATLQESLKKSKETEKRLVAENDALLETLDALESKERLPAPTVAILSTQESTVIPSNGPTQSIEAKLPYSRSVEKHLFTLNSLSTLPFITDVSRNSIVQKPFLSSRSLHINTNPARTGGPFVRVVSLGTSSIRK